MHWSSDAAQSEGFFPVLFKMLYTALNSTLAPSGAKESERKANFYNTTFLTGKRGEKNPPTQEIFFSN